MSKCLFSLERILTERGITQAELADKIGDTQSHVSLVLSGKVSAKLEWCVKVAKALGLEDAEIIGAFFKA